MGFMEGYRGAQQEQLQRALLLADQKVRERELRMREEDQQSRREASEWERSYREQEREDRRRQHEESVNAAKLGRLNTAIQDISSPLSMLPWSTPQDVLAAAQLKYALHKGLSPDLFPDDFRTFMQKHILGGLSTNGQAAQPGTSMPWADQANMPQAGGDQEQPFTAPFAGMIAEPFALPQASSAAPGLMLHGAQTMGDSMPWERTRMPQTQVPPEIASIAPGLAAAGGAAMPPDLVPAAGDTAAALMQALGFSGGMGVRGRNLENQMGRRDAMTEQGWARVGQGDERNAQGWERVRQTDEQIAMRQEMNTLKKPVLVKQAEKLSQEIAAFPGDQETKELLRKTTITHLQNMDRLASFGATMRANQYKRSIQADEIGDFGKIARVAQGYQSRIDGNTRLIAQLHGSMAKLMGKPDANDPNSATAAEVMRISAQADRIAGENAQLKQQLDPVKSLADAMLANLVENGLITDARTQWTPPAQTRAPQRQPAPPVLQGFSGDTGILSGPPAPGVTRAQSLPQSGGLSTPARRLASKYKINVRP